MIKRTEETDAIVIDARETAPAAADRKMYLKKGLPKMQFLKDVFRARKMI